MLNLNGEIDSGQGGLKQFKKVEDKKDPGTLYSCRRHWGKK